MLVPQFLERNPLQHPPPESVGQLWHACHLRVEDAEEAVPAGQGDESVPAMLILPDQEPLDRLGRRGIVVGRSLQERQQRRANGANVLDVGGSHSVAFRLYGAAA